MAKYQAFIEDEMEVEGEEEKEVYLNGTIEEVIEGLDEGELLVVKT